MGTLLGFILGSDRPKREQNKPKRAIRSFKESKSCIFKNLKKPTVFYCFWIQRPPKRTSRGPGRHPRDTQRETQRCSKAWSKSGQKVNSRICKKNDFLSRKNRSDRFLFELFLTPSGCLTTLLRRCLQHLQKIVKMPKNGARMIRKWLKIFQIAQDSSKNKAL